VTVRGSHSASGDYFLALAIRIGYETLTNLEVLDHPHLSLLAASVDSDVAPIRRRYCPGGKSTVDRLVPDGSHMTIAVHVQEIGQAVGRDAHGKESF
jgi:hypothetical protein